MSQLISKSMSPFVRALTLAVIKNIKSRRIASYEDKQVIHADLVPRFSERIINASFRPQMTSAPQGMLPSIEIQEPKPKISVSKRDMSELVKPIIDRPRVPMYFQRTNKPSPQPQPSISIEQQPEMNFPQMAELSLSQDYGKIQNFLEDQSVSTIECPGPGKAIFIIRSGQRQLTRIALSPEEISDILKKVSDVAHIPLIEGVFRAAVENFSINAVISEMVGSRFVIKKQTPYSLLE